MSKEWQIFLVLLVSVCLFYNAFCLITSWLHKRFTVSNGQLLILIPSSREETTVLEAARIADVLHANGCAWPIYLALPEALDYHSDPLVDLCIRHGLYLTTYGTKEFSQTG